MRRLSLEMPGIRPAVLEAEDLQHLRELRGFRHLIVHAYDLVLNRDRLLVLLDHARFIFARIESRYSLFFDAVEQALDF